jgi:integrase
MLEELRGFWKRHRHQKWIFPGMSPGWQAQGLSFAGALHQSQLPMSARCVQETMKQALKDSGLTKRATPHTLRHCFATHLLDQNVNLRLVSQWLGHAKLSTTLVYLQCSESSEKQGREVQGQLLAALGRPLASQ